MEQSERLEKLEDLLIEIRRLLANSMFLIGADKIKKIIKTLDNLGKEKL